MDGKCMHKEVAEFIFSGFSTPKLKSAIIKYCARLALSFYKIGGGSAVEK